MGKVKTVKIDAKGNVVEVYSKPEVILFDIETNTLKKQKPKEKGMTRRLGRPTGTRNRSTGTRSFKKGGKV